MTPEMIAVIAVGVTLMGMNLHFNRETRSEMRRELRALGVRIDERIDELGKRMDEIGKRLDALEARVAALETRVAALDARVGALDARVGALEQRMARIEGLFEGFLRGRIELSPIAAE